MRVFARVPLQPQRSSEPAQARPPAGAMARAAGETSAVSTAGTRGGHDFSRVPVHSVCEREADRVAERVMRMPETQVQPAQERLHLERAGLSGTGPSAVPPGVHDAVASPGQSLDPATRAFMEPRFGYDFSRVRVHVGEQAGAAARSISARAFTIGSDIVFGADTYRPHTAASRQLLAHELAHVVQQASAGPRIQRKEISILDAGTPPEKAAPTAADKKNQRENVIAAASCPIALDGEVVGTLHATPLFYHAYDPDPAKAERRDKPFAGANGVGIALYFMKNGKGAKSGCDFKIIQVVHSEQPGANVPNDFVDINTKEAAAEPKTKPTPYYADWAGNRKRSDGSMRPMEEIPEGYPGAPVKSPSTSTTAKDAPTTVKMQAGDVAIYDRPARRDTDFTVRSDKSNLDEDWTARSFVVCVPPATSAKRKPQILGGITWGFTRAFGKPAVGKGPACADATDKAVFMKTLGSKALVTTSLTLDYDFEDNEKDKKKPA